MRRKNHPSPEFIAVRAHFKRLLQDPLVLAKLPQGIQDHLITALDVDPAAWLPNDDRAVWNAVKVAWGTL
jgi:hypothetical protein